MIMTSFHLYGCSDVKMCGGPRFDSGAGGAKEPKEPASKSQFWPIKNEKGLFRFSCLAEFFFARSALLLR